MRFCPSTKPSRRSSSRRHESWDWAHRARTEKVSHFYGLWPSPFGVVQGAEQKRRIIMRTLSGLMIAAGLIGTIAATGATPTLAQGVYLTFRDRDSESISADLRTGSATTTGATPIMDSPPVYS